MFLSSSIGQISRCGALKSAGLQRRRRKGRLLRTEGERENARCILRQRHFHPLPDNAHAHAVCSRIKGADSTRTCFYRVSREMRRSVSHREHRCRIHGHTRTRVVSCISTVASTRVLLRSPQPAARNREHVTALFDLKIRVRRVENS